MKKVVFSALAASFVGLTAFTIPTSDNAEKVENSPSALVTPSAGTKYTVNTAKSTLGWEAKKVTGEHNGTIKIKKGHLELEGNKPVSGSFEIDMKSIAVLDITDPGYNKKLVDHLNSDDFFSVDKHPTATFKTTLILPNTNAKAGEPTHSVRGNLTLKGITQLISFPVTITTEGNAVRAKADIPVDRSKFDVRYGSTSFFDNLGDKAIYDEFILKLDMVATPGA